MLALLLIAFGLLSPASAAADQAAVSPFEERRLAGRLVAAALERTRHEVRYDGRYVRLEYPGGDVPPEIGVCSDVVIRSYRAVGIDLQRAVHEDMRAHFAAYPNRWGLSRPDTNIDHRRVPNLRTFFARKGQSLPITRRPEAFRPGDLVSWALPGNLPHIGIVVDARSLDGRRPLIVHNVGAGPKLEDVLFAYPMTGHYRYPPARGAADDERPRDPAVDSPTGAVRLPD